MSKKKNTTTPTPHDAAFRSFLANPDVARDFLELHLPAEYRQLCDLSTLKLEPATFVEPDLHQYASDILWSVKTTGGEDGYVYTLIEHQSTENLYMCVFRSIRSRIGIEVRSAIRIHSINRELNFFYRFLTRFFAAFHYRGIFPQ